MTDNTIQPLVEVAEAAYAEYADAAEDRAAAQFDEDRGRFLTAAHATARSRFGSPANHLVWTYMPHADLPADVEEATAPIGPGRTEFLRYRYNAATERTTFELVQPCGACGDSRVNEVSGLTHLGELLAAKGGAR